MDLQIEEPPPPSQPLRDCRAGCGASCSSWGSPWGPGRAPAPLQLPNGFASGLSLLSLFSCSSDWCEVPRGVPRGASTLSITGAPCPVDYPRMTVEAIQAGARPYLFGGRPPSCPACASTEFVAQLCQFNSTGNGLCDRYKVDLLVKEQLSLGFNSLLTFTPCDLFSLVRGRLLFFTGDSQTQDFIKAMQCFTFAMTDLGWHVMDEEGRLEAARQSGFMWHDSRGCVLLPANTRFCFKRCDDYACIVNEVIPLLKKIGKSEDFLIANFGLHFSPDYEGELRNLSSKVEQLRRQGSFPHLLWKDTPPQHFGTYFGEYPQNAGKPPFLCKAVGLEYKPEGEAKWLLQRDHSIKVLYPEWEEICSRRLAQRLGEQGDDGGGSAHHPHLERHRGAA
eukprot:jgi/Botrbrau1/8021/Bobra.13_2s0001.1